jgi:acetyltransferase-like isoleucine patch superfamily enzyme
MSALLAKIKGYFLNSLSLFVIFLPSFAKVSIYRTVFNHTIGKDVKIGLSWIRVDKLIIGDHVRIGHLNRFKRVPHVEIGDHAVIGAGNTFTSTYEFTNATSLAVRGNKPVLRIGRHANITLLHYFDVQDEFYIGPFTVIAGRGSTFFTHYLDVLHSAQSTKPLNVGSYCMVGSGVQFTPGASVPDCCVVGMGAVVTSRFTDTHSLIAGNPAKVIRSLPKDAQFFKRSMGVILSYAARPW